MVFDLGGEGEGSVRGKIVGKEELEEIYIFRRRPKVIVLKRWKIRQSDSQR